MPGKLQPAGDGHDSGAAARRLVMRSLESQLGAPGAYNQTRPLTDPQNQTSASLHSFGQTARIVYGVITDCTAIGNAYRVQFEKAKQPVVAFYGSRTSSSVFGAREVTTLQPGTVVTCIWHEQLPYAQIITVMPPAGTEAKLNQHSVIHGASRNRVDAAHKRPMQMSSNGGIPAMLSGRPFDAITCGETGWITETGIKAFVDSFMAMFGVDEGCQISFHYHDMLCRIAAYQFQLWTGCRETESFNDQDEAQDWTGYAMFPWENMGLASRADPTVVKTARDWQLDTPHYGKMEPFDDFLMPWHREREFHGYLGQGGKISVVAPPIEFTDKGDKGSTGSDGTGAGERTQFTSYWGGDGVVDAKHPGLFDSFITADGRYCVQSAKGLSFTKRAVIVAPTRRRRPEEPAGDNETNYKASGAVGAGVEHKITGDIETNGDHTNFNRAMGVSDMHAYFFNYSGLHPFFYHTEDYSVVEEAEATWTDGKSEEVPDFSVLDSEMYITPENYQKTWNIDHRYGEQKFYTLSSGIELLDDGGVMIFDGYGGCFRMTGGSVEISAPGDIWTRAGRNVNIWSGYDTAIRAKHSWDITASEADGRLKAERNMMLLSGNSGVGGTLIESRSSGPTFNFDTPGEQSNLSGVVIRSPRSPFVTWSNEIYLRTGGGDIANGPIVLDSGRGEGMVVTYAQSQQNYLKDATFWHFNTQEGTVDGPSGMVSATGVLMPGSMCVKGGIIVDGGGVFREGVVSAAGFAAVECPFVGCLKGDALQAVYEALEKCQNSIEREVPQEIGQRIMDTVMYPEFYNDNRPGNDDVILKAEFSLRTQQDYKTSGFVLYEDRWQQLSRLTGLTNAKWLENPVLFQGQDTYPYPGADAFQGDNFYCQDLTIFNPQTGCSTDRGKQPVLNDAYANPKFGETDKTSLHNYTVIR